MDSYLLQVNASIGYADITGKGYYENVRWASKPLDRDHGLVKPGDELLVYCTSSVQDHKRSLAFSVRVKEVSPDRVRFSVDEPYWFPSPLNREAIHSLVAEENLPEIFRRCGVQWFNIAKLDPTASRQVLELLEGSHTPDRAAEAGRPSSPTDRLIARPPGSPADRLIEVHLEEWLVDHWDQVDFGAPLQIYKVDGDLVGQQYDTGAVGRIDLLCEDTSTGALVIIELKKGRQSDAVVGQLTRYMGWVKEHLANGRGVEGIVLAPDYDQRLRYAIKAIPGSRVLRYETRFEILPQDD